MSSQQPNKRTERLAELALLVAGVSYGAQTPVGRELGVWLDKPTIVAVRFVCALPFCLIGLRATSRRLEKSVWHLLPLALLFPTSCLLFTYSFFEASIAVAIFGYYLANLLSSIALGTVVNREPLERSTVIAVGFGLIAAFLIAFGQSGATGTHNALGFALAAASGLCNTAIAQEQKRVSRSFDADTITLAQLLVGITVTVVLAALIGDHTITQLSGEGWLYGLLYGFLFFACNRLMVVGFANAPVGLGSVLLSTEVVVGPLLAYTFFNQTITAMELAGGICTAVAVVVAAGRKREVVAQSAKPRGNVATP